MCVVDFAKMRAFFLFLLFVFCVSSVYSHMPTGPLDTSPYPPIDPSLKCTGCQELVNSTMAALGNNATLASLLQALEAKCNSWGILAGLCDKLVAKLVKTLPTLPFQLYKGGFYTPGIFCTFLSFCQAPCCSSADTAEGIHLSYGSDPTTSVGVTWSTLTKHGDNVINYSEDKYNLDQTATATMTTYTQHGWVGTIHRVWLNQLVPGTTYYYRVGESGEVFTFTTLNQTIPFNFNIGEVADMGDSQESYDNINFLNNLTVTGQIQSIIHAGDTSYADGYAPRWDNFFRMIEPTAARLSYMTIPGNHEFYDEFLEYKLRFLNPGSDPAGNSTLFYSYDIGCVHFVGINTESVIDTPYVDPAQLAWLQQDLQTFNQRRHQAKQERLENNIELPAACSTAHPTFLVAFFHRPMYCSVSGQKWNCADGMKYLQATMEKIFNDNQVDLALYGHMHNYERTVPTYQGNPSTNSPVYILNGAGGNREGDDNDWLQPAPSWSAARIGGTWGAGILTIVNSTALEWNFYRDQQIQQWLSNTNQPLPTAADSVTLTARV